MLKQTQKIPYIAVFKLASGEEFFAKVTDETPVGYTLHKPLCLVPTQGGLQFAPLMMFADPKADIFMPKPVMCSEPHPTFLSTYESAISGIALPSAPKGKIIT